MVKALTEFLAFGCFIAAAFLAHPIAGLTVTGAVLLNYAYTPGKKAT